MKSKVRLVGPVLCAAILAGFLSAGCRQRASDKDRAGAAKQPSEPEHPPAVEVQAGWLKATVSGPYGHDNLTVFLLHGEDHIKGRKFLTLKEALEQKKIVIHETGNVRQLEVENLGDETVFIQAGEILKGGKQDRMLQYDYVIAPKSGRQALGSFCVESGRWSGRAAGTASLFVCSDNIAVGNAMALAGMLNEDQGVVWEEVAKAQDKLSSNVGEDVRDPQSPSSMELTLENKKLKEMGAAYEKALADIVTGREDAIGCAVAINGEVVSADIYGSKALFSKLWPKLLKNAAFTAISEKKTDAEFDAAKPDDVKKFVGKVQDAQVSEKQINESLKMQYRSVDGVVDSFIVGSVGDRLHESLRKDTRSEEQKAPEQKPSE